MEFYDTFRNHVYDFMLIFARIGGIVAFAPLFSARNIPARAKALLAFTMSIVFTGFLSPLQYTAETNSIGLIMQLAGEVSIGAAMGFAASLFFEIIIFAGYIIDYMIGFGFITIVDPQSGASVSIFSLFYSLLAIIVFMLVDGHHIIIEVMVRSYELIPVFGAALSEISMEHVLKMASAIFYVGFQIAAPIYIIMFCIDFTLALISKAVPQIQIIVVGFPLKIGVGLVAIGMILKPTFIFIIHLLETYRDNLLWLFKYWGAP
ncbi:MAG: flagellar biosynthetic protein FliR [Acidobacteriota bacterium]|nr:flagellar biosynthetic protein FliR [Acidobacteriota bacterium]